MTGLMPVVYGAVAGGLLAPAVILGGFIWIEVESFKRRYRAHTLWAFVSTVPRYVYDMIDWREAAVVLSQFAIGGALAGAALVIFAVGLLEVLPT
jgi:hypothetical protein